LYLFLRRSASAFCISIKLSKQPVADGGPTLSPFNAGAKSMLDAGEQQLKRCSTDWLERQAGIEPVLPPLVCRLLAFFFWPWPMAACRGPGQRCDL